ncbi:hypothetical protein [Bacillus sp. EB600]|uniref:hypothetical protein n=1 Tax=Bacillus sp. EB600 TaxID=2806345 RepID=UPI00210A12A4|nr:hypothetical protein [Bacillus sp. EB600]
MKYTIDVANLLGTTHRLNKDWVFRKFTGKYEKEIQSDDLTFDDYAAKLWMQTHDFIEVEGKSVEVDPTSYDLTDPTVSIRPHRTEKPKNPYITKEDLKRVLIAGNEHDHNSLIIDFDGYLHLIPFNRARGGPYAVRFETFLAGNGYVGSQSSLNHINDTYLSLLEGWLEHLVGHDKIYRNYPSDQTKEKLIEKINEAINNL